MAVHTSVLGGVRLTGDEAKKFQQQVTNGRPKKAASASLCRGSVMVKQFEKDGFVKLGAK